MSIDKQIEYEFRKFLMVDRPARPIRICQKCTHQQGHKLIYCNCGGKYKEMIFDSWMHYCSWLINKQKTYGKFFKVYINGKTASWVACSRFCRQYGKKMGLNSRDLLKNLDLAWINCYNLLTYQRALDIILEVYKEQHA